MLLKGLLLLVGSVSECYSKVRLLVGSVKSLLLLVGSVTQESAFYWWYVIHKGLLLLVGSVT